MTDEAKRVEIEQAIEYLREDACASCIFNSYIGECTSVSDCYARKAADLIESISAELEATEAIAALARGLEVERDQLKARLEHVEFERDAAVEDLKYAGSMDGEFCSICKYQPEEECEKRKNECADCFEWRSMEED